MFFWLSPLQNGYNFLKSDPWIIHLSAWEFYCFLIYWFILKRDRGKPSGVLVCWLTVLVAAIQFCTDRELQRKSKWLVWSSFLYCSGFGCPSDCPQERWSPHHYTFKDHLILFIELFNQEATVGVCSSCCSVLSHSLHLHSQCPFIYSFTICPAWDHDRVICH